MAWQAPLTSEARERGFPLGGLYVSASSRRLTHPPNPNSPPFEPFIRSITKFTEDGPIVLEIIQDGIYSFGSQNGRQEKDQLERTPGVGNTRDIPCWIEGLSIASGHPCVMHRQTCRRVDCESLDVE